MDFTDMRYFLAACETLNFTRAAENCNVSPPTITRSIQKLEDEFGGQLFRRERRLTHLTDLGRLMQMHLAQAVAAAEAAELEASRFAAADTRLRLGVFSTMSAPLLVRYLQRVRRTAPDLDLDIWESSCADIALELKEGRIDVAIMSLPEYPGELRPAPLYDEPYNVAFAPGHRFEAMPAVPLRELEGEDYVKRMHCEFPSNFARLDVAKPYDAVRVRYATEREDWVHSMVAAGLGVTLMPEFMALSEGVLIRPVVEPAVSRSVSIVTRAGRRHSRPVELALRVARSLDWTFARAAA